MKTWFALAIIVLLSGCKVGNPKDLPLTNQPITSTSTGSTVSQQTGTIIPSLKSTTYQINQIHTGFVDFGQPLTFPTSTTWQVTMGSTVSYPLIADGKVFVLTSGTSTYNYGAQLHALDLATGQEVWGPIDIPGLFNRVGHTYDNGKIFVLNHDGVLRSFDAATGAAGWSKSIPGQSSFTAAPNAVQGIVYVGGAGVGGTLYAVNESNGNVLWSNSVANGDESSPTVSADSVFVSYPCQVYRFNKYTGTSLWHYNGSCSGGGGKTSVYSNGSLYVRDTSANPIGSIFNGTTGSITGTFGSTSMIPMPAFNATAGFFMNGATLQSLNPASLSVNWSFTGDGLLTSAPIAVGDAVIAGSSSGNVYALDAATGSQLWSSSVGTTISAPDEHNALILTGFGAGEGYLVVPAGSSVTAWKITP